MPERIIQGKQDKAVASYKEALEFMDNSPNLWEKALVMHDAGRVLKDDALCEEAIQILKDVNARADLKRLGVE